MCPSGTADNRKLCRRMTTGLAPANTVRASPERDQQVRSSGHAEESRHREPELLPRDEVPASALPARRAE